MYWEKMRSFLVQAIEHASTVNSSTSRVAGDASNMDTSSHSADVNYGTDADTTTCATSAKTGGAIPTMPSSFMNIAQEAIRGKQRTGSTTDANSKKDI